VDLASFSHQLEELRERALKSVAGAADPRSLEEVETHFLGRRGELRTLLGTIGQLPTEDRPRVGALARRRSPRGANG
jgi:phenylalanyl-tRNA synthetase alpha chain